jgi:hypothetical protein
MSSLNNFYRRKRQIRTIAIGIAFVVLATIIYCIVANGSGTIAIDDGYTTYYAKTYVERDGCVEFVDNFGRSHKLCGVYHITKY